MASGIERPEERWYDNTETQKWPGGMPSNLGRLDLLELGLHLFAEKTIGVAWKLSPNEVLYSQKPVYANLIQSLIHLIYPQSHLFGLPISCMYSVQTFGCLVGTTGSSLEAPCWAGLVILVHHGSYPAVWGYLRNAPSVI